MDQKAKGELLLYCLNMGVDETKTSRFEQLSNSDWDEFVEQSDSHGIAPLLYHRFMTTGAIAHIPNSVMLGLQRLYRDNAWRNTQLYNEASKVLRILQNAGIPVIVLKGAALAEIIYHSIALRPMIDVDILVKAEDMLRTDEVLTQSGYKSNIATFFSKRYIMWRRHVHYSDEAKQFCAEIHPGISDLPDLDYWKNASHAKIASTDTLILGAEDFLLHLCVHVDVHICLSGSAELIRWYDIAELLKHYEKDLNWDYVIRIAKEKKVEGVIHSILHVINEWFNGNVPVDILDQLRENGTAIPINDMPYTVKELTSKKKSHDSRTLLPSLLFIPRIPSIHNKIYHIFRIIFPCREFMMQHYSVVRPKCVYFYYPIRIGELAIEAIQILCKLPSYLKSRS